MEVCYRPSNDCSNELTMLEPDSTKMVHPCLRRHYYPAATSQCDIGSRLPIPTALPQPSSCAMNGIHMVLPCLHIHTHVLWDRLDEYHGKTHEYAMVQSLRLIRDISKGVSYFQ